MTLWRSLRSSWRNLRVPAVVVPCVPEELTMSEMAFSAFACAVLGFTFSTGKWCESVVSYYLGPRRHVDGRPGSIEQLAELEADARISTCHKKHAPVLRWHVFAGESRLRRVPLRVSAVETHIGLFGSCLDDGNSQHRAVCQIVSGLLYCSTAPHHRDRNTR